MVVALAKVSAICVPHTFWLKAVLMRKPSDR
jgi:hypothetical protein